MQDHTTRNSSNVKTCTKCGTTKPLNEFSLDKTKKTGRQSHCKACIRENSRRWYQKNSERRREGVLRWRQENPDKVREGARQWAKKNPEKIREKGRRRAQAHPEKVRAKNAVSNAVRMGRIPPASNCFCFICGTSSDQGATMHYHHVKYDKPLEVFPLCVPCHAAWHEGNSL